MRLSWNNFKTLADVAVTVGDLYYTGSGTTASPYSIFIKSLPPFCLIDGSVANDKTDFEDNYKSNCNQIPVETQGLANFKSKNLFRYSDKLDAVGGMSNPPNKMSFKFSEEVLLFGGKYMIVGTVADGDYLRVGVTDEDNVLGYGAGYILKIFMENELLIPATYTANAPFIDDCQSQLAGKLIDPLFYITVFHYSPNGVSPANDLDIYMRLYPWKL